MAELCYCVLNPPLHLTMADISPCVLNPALHLTMAYISLSLLNTTLHLTIIKNCLVFPFDWIIELRTSIITLCIPYLLSLIEVRLNYTFPHILKIGYIQGAL